VRSVLVMRHCVRSTPEEGIKAVPGFENFNSYSASQWPTFPVTSMSCLPRGLKLMEASGKWLRDRWLLPEPVHISSDDSQRDKDTSRALLMGFAGTEQKENFITDSASFDTLYSDACPELTAAEEAEARREQLAIWPVSSDLLQLQAKLFSALGTGVAGDWTAVPCHVSDTGQIVGSCQAAFEFTERLLMQAGGGLTMGWGNLSFEDVQALLPLSTYYLRVSLAAPKLLKRKQPAIMRSVLSALEADDGTEIFMGHDTQLVALAAALDLSWDPHPYHSNATLPGSALRFDRRGDDVEISYIYPDNFLDDHGAMGSVSASTSSISFSKLRRQLELGSDAACTMSSEPRIPRREARFVF